MIDRRNAKFDDAVDELLVSCAAQVRPMLQFIGTVCAACRLIVVD